MALLEGENDDVAAGSPKARDYNKLNLAGRHAGLSPTIKKADSSGGTQVGY
jgi:hypothetical protein